MSEPRVFLCIIQVCMYCICFRNVGDTMAELFSSQHEASGSIPVSPCGIMVDIVALGQVFL